MIKFLFKRLIQATIVMFFISIIAFAIQGGLGDPTRELTGMSVTLEQREELRDRMGLNDPFVVQYMRFVSKALQGISALRTSLNARQSILYWKKCPPHWN